MMIRGILRILRDRGPAGLASAFHRLLFKPRVARFDDFVDAFRNRTGFEIGGPSDVFRRGNLFPVYAVAAGVDNCNFAGTTTWEGQVRTGDTFVFDDARCAGRQFVAEATDLGFLGDASYDFVLSSHALEHMANPLKALAEWRRILKPGGLIALVLPERNRTFDRHRPVTPLEHLIDDQRRDVGEDDLTHVAEILALHDLSRDPGAGGSAAFAERAHRNSENRCLHHHVFDPELATAVLEHAHFEVLSMQTCEPFHIFVVARKPAVREASRLLE